MEVGIVGLEWSRGGVQGKGLWMPGGLFVSSALCLGQGGLHCPLEWAVERRALSLRQRCWKLQGAKHRQFLRRSVSGRSFLSATAS